MIAVMEGSKNAELQFTQPVHVFVTSLVPSESPVIYGNATPIEQKATAFHEASTIFASFLRVADIHFGPSFWSPRTEPLQRFCKHFQINVMPNTGLYLTIDWTANVSNESSTEGKITKLRK